VGGGGTENSESLEEIGLTGPYDALADAGNAVQLPKEMLPEKGPFFKSVRCVSCVSSVSGATKLEIFTKLFRGLHRVSHLVDNKQGVALQPPPTRSRHDHSLPEPFG
jgi:hypothetical protein